MVFDDLTEPQMVLKILLHVSFIKLHNIIISDPNDRILKEARDEEINTIISGFTLRTFLKPQFKKCQQNTRSCVFVNVSFMLKLYLYR